MLYFVTDYNAFYVVNVQFYAIFIPIIMKNY